MKRLNRLDFMQRRPTPWAGWLILIAGLALLATAALPLWEQQQAQLEREQRLAALTSAAPGARSTRITPTGDKREQARTQELLQRLNAPWGELFAVLEQHASSEIGLLQVEPDAPTRQLRLTALARNLDSMVAWLRELQGDARLADVLLLQHQTEEQTPGQPIRFRVTAQWRAAPAPLATPAAPPAVMPAPTPTSLPAPTPSAEASPKPLMAFAMAGDAVPTRATVKPEAATMSPADQVRSAGGPR